MNAVLAYPAGQYPLVLVTCRGECEGDGTIIEGRGPYGRERTCETCSGEGAVLVDEVGKDDEVLDDEAEAAWSAAFYAPDAPAPLTRDQRWRAALQVPA